MDSKAIHTRVSILPQAPLPSHPGCRRTRSRLPGLHGRPSLIMCLTYSTVRMSVLNSLFIHPPPVPWQPEVRLYVCESLPGMQLILEKAWGSCPKVGRSREAPASAPWLWEAIPGPRPASLQAPVVTGSAFPVSLAGLRGPAWYRVLSREPASLKTWLSKPLQKRKAFKISNLPLVFPTGSRGK